MAYADKISLIRHYPYVKNETHAEFEGLVLKKRISWLDEIEQTRLDKIEEKLRLQTFEDLTEEVRKKIARCLDADNNFLFCYEPMGKVREIDTAHDLIKRFQIPKKKIFEIEMPWPEGRGWMDFIGAYRKKLNSILIYAAWEDSRVREVVFVWRRSDSYSFLNYAPILKAEALEARKILEKQVTITVDIDGKLYPWAAYISALLAIEKNVDFRMLKKLLESWEVTVNGVSTGDFCPRLALGDRVRYKNRVVEIGISKDGEPVFTKILPD